MKRNVPRRRGISLLLALAMVLTLVPTALAASFECPKCGSTHYTKTVVAEANCHERGVDRYVCKECNTATLVETDIDTKNHDAVCTDNGDGKTHTADCPYDSYYNRREEHDFDDTGRCVKCLAVNYDNVELSLPRDSVVYGPPVQPSFSQWLAGQLP